MQACRGRNINVGLREMSHSSITQHKCRKRHAIIQYEWTTVTGFVLLFIVKSEILLLMEF